VVYVFTVGKNIEIKVKVIELTRRKKSTKFQLQQKLDEVRKLMSDNKSLREISDILGIPLRTVEYYSKKIFQQDKESWKAVEKESLEGRAEIIKSYYEKGSEMCEKIMNDEKKTPRDRIESFKTLIACQNNIYNMLNEMPRFKINTIRAKPLEDKSDPEL